MITTVSLVKLNLKLFLVMSTIRIYKINKCWGCNL